MNQGFVNRSRALPRAEGEVGPLSTLTGGCGSPRSHSLKVKLRDLQWPVTHTAPSQSCQISGEARRVNWPLWDAQILLHLRTTNSFVVWWMQSKQGLAGVVVSPELKIRRDEQNKCTKLHICPMNVEAFVKEGEVLHWCDASSGFSQHDDPVWPKQLT